MSSNTSSPEDLPAVSLLLVAYRQEEFVAVAVKSALNQDYPNLEIILSDDHSPDNTYAIMTATVAANRSRHRVILNQSGSNLRLAGHLNQVISKATGDLIVIAAGDDVSAPHRVSRIVDLWNQNGRPGLVHSHVTYIDKNGGTIDRPESPNRSRTPTLSAASSIMCKRFIDLERGRILGCTEAFSRGFFDAFGDFHDNTIQEDDVLAFRATIEGGLLYIPESLVQYRVHQSNVWLSQSKAPSTLAAQHKIKAKTKRILAIELENRVAAQAFSYRDRKRMQQKLLSQVLYHESSAELIEASGLHRLKLLTSKSWHGRFRWRKTLRRSLKSMARLLRGKQ